MQPLTLAKRTSLLVFLGIIAFYLYGLGQLPLLGPDEPRYAQVAREMLLRGDLITPTLGGHPWFEKPALLYWMMVGSYKLFGVSEWSARFPSAVCGLLTIVAVFLIGRRTEQLSGNDELRGLGLWTGLAACTTLGIVVFSRAASFDIVLTMTIAWSLACFFIHELQSSDERRIRWLIGFYVFMGLALLAKGFVGVVIPGGVAVTYHLLRRRVPLRGDLLSLFWGAPLALAVAATWYGPVIWRNGQPFIDQFIWQHQFARYLSNNYRHPGPIYYYIVLLVPLSLPWAAFFINGLTDATHRIWRAHLSQEPASKLLTFLVAWLLLPLLFFSLSRSKLPGYILPALPAAMLLIGERLARFTSNQDRNIWKLKATGALLVLAGVGSLAYAGAWPAWSSKCAILVAIVATGVGSIALFLRGRRDFTIALICIGTVVLVVSVLHCGAVTADRYSSKRLLQLADARGYSQTLIYGLKLDDRSPEFYAPGRVIYRADGEPVVYEGAPYLVNECRRRNTTLLAFVPLEGVDELKSAHAASTEVIGDNGIVALVSVRPR